MTHDRNGGLREALLLFPRLAQLLGRLFRDPGVSGWDKALLAMAITYVVNPFDLMPDALPFLGQIDDLYLAALALLRLLNRAGSERLAAHWDGPGDLISSLRFATEMATAILPPRIRARIAGLVGGRYGEGYGERYGERYDKELEEDPIGI